MFVVGGSEKPKILALDWVIPEWMGLKFRMFAEIPITLEAQSRTYAFTAFSSERSAFMANLWITSMQLNNVICK